MSDVALELTLTDNLGFWREGAWAPVGPAKVTRWYVRLPSEWLVGLKLTPWAEDRFYAHLYGAAWKNGNDDGSRYMPQSVTVRVVDEAELAGKRVTHLQP